MMIENDPRYFFWHSNGGVSLATERLPTGNYKGLVATRTSIWPTVFIESSLAQTYEAMETFCRRQMAAYLNYGVTKKGQSISRDDWYEAQALLRSLVVEAENENL